MKDNFMKKPIKIMKAGCLFLCSVFIIFEIYILVNSNKIDEITAALAAENESEAEEDFYGEYEVEIPIVPMANFIIDEDETEIKTEFETETTETFEIAEITEPTGPAELTLTEPVDTEAETKIEIEKETETELEEVFIIDQPTETNLLSKDVPILMYHTSSENNPGALAELYVKPSEFEKQVQYLSENGFTFCTFDDYYNLNNISKPVFITFDDGYKENYTEIFPILKKYETKITLFLTLNSITDSNITLDMIIEMNESGLVKFESHTNTHPSLVAISSNETNLTNEIQNSKTKIEEITGKTVLALAYPNGEFNDTVKEKTKEFYLFGLRKDLGMHNTAYDPYEVRRIRINRSTSLAGFINYVG